MTKYTVHFNSGNQHDHPSIVVNVVGGMATPEDARRVQEIIDSAERAQGQSDPSVAAIQFALTTDQGMHFLRLWNEGEFDLLRECWPEAPDEIYIGADPLFEAKVKGNG